MDRIDNLDRLAVISEKLLGMSQLLSTMRECEEMRGETAEHYYLLQTVTEECGKEISEIIEGR